MTFLVANKGGTGAKSATMIFIVAKARELMVYLNNNQFIVVICLRSQHYAQMQQGSINYDLPQKQYTGLIKPKPDLQSYNPQHLEFESYQTINHYNATNNICSPIIITNSN